MINRDYRDYIRDIIDSINDIESFTENITFEDLARDRKTINAVIRSIEIIGEAAKRVSQPIKDKNPSIPWKRMAGMRDKLIHEYFGVDKEILWKTIKNSLPELKDKIAKVIEEQMEID